MTVLRRDGRKLPELELRLQPVLRGDLGVEHEGQSGPVARLRSSTARHELFRPLLNVRIVPMRGDSFVVAGVQETQPPGASRLLQRQAWWCRLPKDDLAAAQRLLLAKLGIGTGVLVDDD
ncbi:hypothetical protein HLB44_16880 [Aquincola sp. S2]|uniref:Uncharacterized protein n=1 Tax=Pseudaquabacterium terrae TaxID=2732868 RepID=A0ABX2EJ78_9BURK|nr:hypothetical protein [Aquabacterium terrae]NRF68669.1 hypothetical protein [Aquabacterium terrae]